MKDKSRSLLTAFLLRAAIALPLIIAALILFCTSDGHILAAGAQALIASSLLVVGAVILAFPVAHLLAAPFTGFYFPERRLLRPLPMYSVPQALRTQGKYEEAMIRFREIAEKYPREVKPWIEMLEVAVVSLNDEQRAQAIFEEGMTALDDEDRRSVLERMYSAISSRLSADLKDT